MTGVLNRKRSPGVANEERKTEDHRKECIFLFSFAKVCQTVVVRGRRYWGIGDAADYGCLNAIASIQL
jgi:hypothetical protein